MRAPVLAAGVGLLLLAIAAAGVDLGPVRMPRAGRGVSDAAAAAGRPVIVRAADVSWDAGPYPAPLSEPTATPLPDADGFLPPPAGLPFVLVTPPQAPAADLLADLGHQLAARDAAGLAARAASDRRPLTLLPWGPWDSEGLAALDPTQARLLLEGLLGASGTVPRIQGLFYLPSPSGDGACADVLLHRFSGRVAWPPALPSAAPTSVVQVGGPPPAELGPEAAAWRFCHAARETDWTWETWWVGPYHGLLARLAERHRGAAYWALRP